MRIFLIPLLIYLVTGGVSKAQVIGPRYSTPTRGLRVSWEDVSPDSLPRVKTVSEIAFFKEIGFLVDLPEKIPGLVKNITGKNSRDRMVATPRLIFVLETIGKKFRAKRRKDLLLTSTLRPESQQTALRNSRKAERKKGRAVSMPAEASASFHPTGTAADISVRNLRPIDVVFLRKILKTYKNQGLVDYVEEKNPHHFHIEAKAPLLDENPSKYALKH